MAKSKKKTNIKYDKNDFLYILANYNPIELNKIIEERGKKARITPLIVWDI